jgi:O-antigen/teichoic acid export membrane protein
MYWKNVSSVFTGTLVAQAIPIIGSIFIARIFIPSEFGKFSAWLAIVTFVSVIITLRFEAVLAIAEDGVERLKAVFFTFLIAIVMSILILLFLILGKNLPWILSYYSESTLLWLSIAPAALFFALNQVCQMWAAAEGLYVKLIIMRLVQASTLIALQISLGLQNPFSTSLAIGFLVACMIGLGYSIMIMPRFIYIHFFCIEKFKIFLIRYKSFPLFALPADSINTAVAQLPVLIVAFRFGSEIAGYLALSMRVIGAPIGLISKAVLDVFKRQAVQNIQKIGNCRSLYVNTLGVLTFASLILVVGTIYLAEEIFLIAFGLEWIVSAEMAKWLLPMFALGMIASPLSYIVYLVEKQHIDLLWQIGLMIVAIVNLNIFSSYQSSLIGYSVGYAFMYIIYIFISFRLSNG